MNITLYKTLLNECGHSYLVAEKTFKYEKSNDLNNTMKIVDLMNDIFQTNLLDTEYVYMITMDTKCYPIGVFEVSHGTVNASLLQPRELIIKALLANAVNVILVHNHPSRIAEPSDTDLKTTNRIKDAFNLVGLTLSDHIIISRDSFYSFAGNKLL